MPGAERDWLRLAAAVAVTLTLTALLWRLVPGRYLGIGWMAVAVLLLELGLRHLPDEFALLAWAVAAMGALRVWFLNIVGLPHSGPWDARLVPLWAALLAYTLAVRARPAARGRAFAGASSAGLVFLLAALWAMLSTEWVAVAWAATALALLVGERRWRLPLFGWQSVAVAALACLPIGRDLADPDVPLWTGAAAIACLFAAQLVAVPASRRRLFYSLTATTFTTLLLYFRISGKMLTFACAMQGAAWLALGFPMRDRLLRLSGLALLLACILKLFLWDLRRLETLPRIFSFIALGLILLAVSWVYTRFRERVVRFL
jgi:hypothetical protein